MSPLDGASQAVTVMTSTAGAMANGEARAPPRSCSWARGRHHAVYSVPSTPPGGSHVMGGCLRDHCLRDKASALRRCARACCVDQMVGRIRADAPAYRCGQTLVAAWALLSVNRRACRRRRPREVRCGSGASASVQSCGSRHATTISGQRTVQYAPRRFLLDRFMCAPRRALRTGRAAFNSRHDSNVHVGRLPAALR